MWACIGDLRFAEDALTGRRPLLTSGGNCGEHPEGVRQRQPGVEPSGETPGQRRQPRRGSTLKACDKVRGGGGVPRLRCRVCRAAAGAPRCAMRKWCLSQPFRLLSGGGDAFPGVVAAIRSLFSLLRRRLLRRDVDGVECLAGIDPAWVYTATGAVSATILRNKALQGTAIPLRSIAAGGLERWAASPAPPAERWRRSVKSRLDAHSRGPGWGGLYRTGAVTAFLLVLIPRIQLVLFVVAPPPLEGGAAE